jgi:hypothetical protein
VPSRYITVTAVEKGPQGGFVYTRDVWRVPADFSEQEERLFAEMCAEGVISESDAIECVRLLRK